MAETSIVNGMVEYIKVGNTTNAIASTAYGYCETAAGTAIKNVLMTGFKLETGVTVHIKFANTNSAANPKLKFNGEADANAKAIMQYGTTAAGTAAATTGWNAGAVVTLTYDGTNWIRDQGFNTNTTYSYMRPYGSTASDVAAKTGSAGWKFQLTAGKYFMFTQYYDNTAQSALTLNIGSTGAKPIYINGQPSSASNYTLPGGQYLVYYDGTNYYFRTDDKMTGDITGDAATVNGHTVEKDVPSNAVFTDTKSFTITANATDGYWNLTGTNGTNSVTYALAPYSSKQSGANFYTGTTNPDGNTRLNYNGYLYASKLYSNGTEVSVNGHNHDSAYSAIHQTSWNWASDGTKPLSKYVTFDANIAAGNAEKAPDAGWYNGFVTSHGNYLASFILNKHRTDKWYVGWEQYPKDGSTVYTEPTWYLLAHSGNVETGDNNGQIKIAGVNIGVKGLAALAYKANLAWDEITQTGADNLPEGSSNWTDNTEILTSYASNNGFADTNAKGKIYRRDAITAWNYVNGKAASVYAKLASPAFNGTPTAPTAANGTSTTQIATTEFVNNTLAYANAMTFKGTLGTGGTVTELPASHNAGDTYRVITADTWAGKYCEVGTLIICTTDGTTANDAHWTSVETNEDGAVIGTTPTSSTDNAIVRWDGSSGRIIQNSATTLDDNGCIKITHVGGKSHELQIVYSTTIDYWWGVGTANENHGLYDNKANKWILSAAADNKWYFVGNATTATSSKALANLYGDYGTAQSSTTRPDTANIAHVTNGGVTHFKVTSETKATGKPMADGNILHFHWDTSVAWDSQLYIPDGSTDVSMQWRGSSAAGTWDSWRTLLDSSNYTDYTVTKTGTGASGTWGISITGSSASCTGNAATAAAIQTAGTTAQFYRGDNSWSNTIKQTANAALGVDTNLKIGTARKDLNFDIATGTGTGINDGYAGGITWGTGTAAHAGIYCQTSGGYGTRLIFGTTGSYAKGAYARMIIQSNGKVGIGTLSPDALLTVNGNGKFTGQIITSFKSSIAPGSYGSAQTTIPDLLEEVRYSSGCAGSFSLTTAYTLNNVTLATGWYNFMYIPHRSGGVNGAASNDNCDYGALYLHRMNATGYADYVLAYSSGAAKLLDLHASFQSAITDGQILVADGTLGHIKTSGYTPSSFSASNHTHVTSISSGGTATVTLSANTAYTLTAGGTSVIFKTPVDNNNYVSQSASTTANWRKILLHYEDDAAPTTAVTSSTNVVYSAVGVSVQPSTGTIRAGAYNVLDKVKLEYNSTDDSLDFIFI